MRTGSPEIRRLGYIQYLNKELLPLIARKNGTENRHYKILSELSAFLQTEKWRVGHYYYSELMKLIPMIEKLRDDVSELQQKSE